MSIVEIWINCPDATVARAIGEGLVARRLVACANVHAPVASVYQWKGQIETAEEIPVVLKTRESLFDEVCDAVRALHPYETPSVIAVPVARVNADYAAWVVGETRAPNAAGKEG